MKILVCMKQVPQKDAPLKLNESGTWIREDVSYEVNEPDAYALEEALRQKEKHGFLPFQLNSKLLLPNAWMAMLRQTTHRTGQSCSSSFPMRREAE